ncbi:hypothetical protein [Paenibacillus sp. 1P07SE]|uniref:hypothetical protein n=1 Tax=Paenibacillus sp. 1P07SE TaxID=3132209 RepID=UPI0039A4630C
MTLTLQAASTIKGNTMLLPDISLTVEEGKPVAVQSDIEWLEPFHALYLSPSPVFTGSHGSCGPQERFVYLQSDGLSPRLTPRQHIRLWNKLYNQSTDKITCSPSAILSRSPKKHQASDGAGTEAVALCPLPGHLQPHLSV